MRAPKKVPKKPARRPRGRPAGTLMNLSGARYLNLLHELRHGGGPVNLSATAKKYGISRSTIQRYVNGEPGLREAVDARREREGGGYVPVKRGTRESRAAAKERLQQRRQVPPPAQPDRPLPPAVQRSLDRSLEELGSFERWMEEQGELEAESPEAFRARVASTLPKPLRRTPSPEEEARRATRAAFRAFSKSKG